MIDWIKPGATVFIKGPRNDYIGRIVSVPGSRLIELEDASWVADSGRYLSTFILTGRADGNEIEPVGRGVFSWDDIYQWPHKLPKERLL